MTDLPTPAALRELLDRYRPATVLARVAPDAPPELLFYRAKALAALDRHTEARACLDPVVPQLRDDDFSRAERLWAEILLRAGSIDGAILAAESAADAAEAVPLRAAALATAAVGWARKRCWTLGERALREALEMAPDEPRVLVNQARFRLAADQRVEARTVYERMAGFELPWVGIAADLGRGHVAYLLGEFDRARELAQAALSRSDEVIWPFFLLQQLARVAGDVEAMAAAIDALARRSPEAESLAGMREELERSRRQHEGDASRKRLTAFPTTEQKRNYCGPCTIELVLRYWKGGIELTNEQIAQKVKHPGGGTPIHRLKEFFRLVGFDTVRCLAPAERLRQLVDAGFPVIVEQEYSDTLHVAVVIGYDDEGAFELQDPMTHAITTVAEEELARLRHNFCDAAVVAFPQGKGHDKTLARLGLFDDAVVALCDQAGLALDSGRPAQAAALMQRACERRPEQGYCWILGLDAELTRWRNARVAQPSREGLAARLQRKAGEDPDACRERFHQVLQAARGHHPEAEFVFQLAGRAALLDNDPEAARDAFRRAHELDPGDSRNLASLAECYYALRELPAAVDAARQSLARNPALAAANAWMARCCAQLHRSDGEHYARAAVALAENGWVAQLALAEVLLDRGERDEARRALELAASLSGGHADVAVSRAVALSIAGEDAEAAAQLEQILADGNGAVTPSTRYKAHQALCRILFGGEIFDAAVEQGELLLTRFPDDAWAMQFPLAARCEQLIREGAGLEGEGLTSLCQRYERALQAYEGAAWVAADYLGYLEQLAGTEQALAAASRLRETLPESGALVFLQGRILRNAGRLEQAARVMLEALGRRGGVSNAGELDELVSTVCAGLGPEETEQRVLGAPDVEGGPAARDRKRALGLVLAHHEDQEARARDLLGEVLAKNPDDAVATLRLGWVTAAESDRETLYRRALMLAPGWSHARATLASHLVDVDREAEALEFTSGHESESHDLLVEHGRALFGLGRFEEAVQVFGRAVAEEPEASAYLHYLKWAAQDAAGLHAQALETADLALAAFVDDLDWYGLAAASLRQLGRFDEAAARITEGQAKGMDRADVLRAEYKTAWMKKEYAEALAAVEQLIELEGEQAGDSELGHWEKKRLDLLLELDRVDEVRTFLEQENLDAEGWGEAAWTVLRSGQEALALELAERALALDDACYEGLYTRAQALSDLDREDEAIAAFHQLREAHPQEHNAYEKLAVRLAVEGKLDEARLLAERAVDLGSFCPLAWVTRGFVRFLQGEVDRAREDLQTSWNRSDGRRRQETYEYWWLLAALEGDGGLAAQRKRQAEQEAETELTRRIIAAIEGGLTARV